MIKPTPPKGQTIYREERFSLRSCELTFGAAHIERRAVVIHHGSVVILPLTTDGQVVLIENKRWQIGCRILELPAGTMARAEDPITCASRELLEETGYQAGQLDYLQSIYALPGLSTEVMHIYVARDLEWVGQSLEQDEDIQVRLTPLEEIHQLILDGAILDGKTLAVLSSFLLRHADIKETAE
ncbi:MAG: NUDIX hydrolase [Myxococcota bacterium]|nr:NUDIX hydrolase [Myxococcota bacterium]